MLYPKYAALSIIATTLAPTFVNAKAVFCHYMVQGLSERNAQADIDAASKMGCDAFALDLTDPTTSWTKSTLEYMFKYAATTKFRLFFSIDTAACPIIKDNDDLLDTYLTHAGYYKFDGVPFLSTFHGANILMSDWQSFLASHGNPYFVPNFDDITDYSSDPTTYLAQIKNIVNGTMAWEDAWPLGGSRTPVSSLLDASIQSASTALDLTYIAPMSTFQFKDMAQSGFYYRCGGVTLPQRMSQLLSSQTPPDNVEIISWNDAGESHYIGTIHPDSQPPSYADPSQWDHTAWQPVIASFIAAYKSGAKSAAAMVPPAGAPAVGAVWYRTVLRSAGCEQPKGGDVATDNVNFAVVLPKESTGYHVRIRSGGQVIKTIPAKGGLNYASVPGMRAGKQVLELVDAEGKACMTADGIMEVQAEAEGHCNWNYQVAGLKEPGALKAPTVE